MTISLLASAAASGWAGWALAHLEFGSSVNPITTRGADYAHHITASPPGFEIPAASLYIIAAHLLATLLDAVFNGLQRLSCSVLRVQLNHYSTYISGAWPGIAPAMSHNKHK